MGIEFAWDEEKNCSNQKKHGVSFEEAETIFYDDDALLNMRKSTLVVKSDLLCWE